MNAPVFIAQKIRDGVLLLGEEESHHCIRVLRLKESDRVVITDGKGTWAYGRIEDPHPRKTGIRVLEIATDYKKRPFYLHMAVAPTKSIDRFETFLEKATECGVDEITPVICAKSERRVVKTHRMQRIVEAAMKQSLRAYMPRVNPVAELSEFIRGLSGSAEHRFIAHCMEHGTKHLFRDLYTGGGDPILLVGPEGDFTDQEIETAKNAGFQAISLGEHRLRTETAALVLCIQANTLNGVL